MQVLDIPAAALTVTEYQMMCRTCGCGQVTTAPPPPGVTGGPVCHGPNVVAAATLPASTGVIGIERAADLTGALLSAPVSAGFISRCLARLGAALIAAGFEGALRDALRTAGVSGTDETPAPLTTAATSAEGCGSPHVEHRADHAGLYRRRRGPHLVRRGGQPHEAGDHGSGIPGGYRGVLVRDDYGGDLSYDAGLAGVQQRLARLYRYPGDTYATGPASRAWTRQAGDALRAASAAVRTARGEHQAGLDPALLAGLRHSYDQAVQAGISGSLSRPWHKQGKPPPQAHPRPAPQAQSRAGWLFTTRFDVRPTSNGSENAIRGCKLAARISGCWRTLATLRRHCRIRSCLTTARSHGRHPLAAIRDALNGTCWMPPAPA